MQITETLRITRANDLNVILEQLITNENPKTKEPVTKWHIVGYFNNTRLALKRIIDQDMLVDLNATESLKSYLKSFSAQLAIIDRAINEVDD